MANQQKIHLSGSFYCFHCCATKWQSHKKWRQIATAAAAAALIVRSKVCYVFLHNFHIYALTCVFSLFAPSAASVLSKKYTQRKAHKIVFFFLSFVLYEYVKKCEELQPFFFLLQPFMFLILYWYQRKGYYSIGNIILASSRGLADLL